MWKSFCSRLLPFVVMDGCSPDMETVCFQYFSCGKFRTSDHQINDDVFYVVHMFHDTEIGSRGRTLFIGNLMF